MEIETSKTVYTTESDVEQKFIFPLLNLDPPHGLGYSNANIRTKPDIRSIAIDKGRNEKLYFPDYILMLSGFPVCVIEAKKPEEDMEEAFREARLYASEINSSYPTKFNPCEFIIVSDALNTKVGKWDSSTFDIVLKLENVDVSTPIFCNFIDQLKKESIEIKTFEYKKQLRDGARFYKPVFLLGGQTVRNELVGENSFGANLSIEYKFLYNPETEEEKKEIVKNAYVPSHKRESHIRPIEKLIRKVRTPSSTIAHPIEDTSKPDELINTIENFKQYKNEVCLLIGSVGSGKSTFIEYLKEVAISVELREKIAWIICDLNNAPVSKDLCYKWIITEIINNIKKNQSKIDFDEIDVLKQVFSEEIAKLKKGPASLYEEDSKKFIDILFDSLQTWISDEIIFLQAIIKFISKRFGRRVIIVLDNSDKRDRDNQLLMFEVANWLKSKFSCMIFLTIRESTYDSYHNEPPLDTVINDLVFRIDPPLLERVLYDRFKYALRIIEDDQSKFSYYIDNGIRVDVERDHVFHYLKSMLSSIFQNQFSKRLFVGIAGRNIRKGLELFLSICKSGYISEDLILKINESRGEEPIPPHILMTILMKGTRRYYNDDKSKIKNIFHSDGSDNLPDPFIRGSILKWLLSKSNLNGPTGVKGYHKASNLISDLLCVGHSQETIIQEISSLIQADCITSESQMKSMQDIEELISISSAGHVHLDLLSNITYLSIIAEDTFIKNTDIANKIAENISGRGKFPRLSKQISLENSKYLYKWITKYREELPFHRIDLLKNSINELTDYSEYHKVIQSKIDADRDYTDYEILVDEYPTGTEVDALVTGVQPYGIFFEFGTKGIAFLSKDSITMPYEYIEPGGWYRIQIVKFNRQHRKFDVELAQ